MKQRPIRWDWPQWKSLSEYQKASSTLMRKMMRLKEADIDYGDELDNSAEEDTSDQLDDPSSIMQYEEYYGEEEHEEETGAE